MLIILLVIQEIKLKIMGVSIINLEITQGFKIKLPISTYRNNWEKNTYLFDKKGLKYTI